MSMVPLPGLEQTNHDVRQCILNRIKATAEDFRGKKKESSIFAIASYRKSSDALYYLEGFQRGRRLCKKKMPSG